MWNILCFGDSIMFGVGELPMRGWCGRLKEWWEPQGDYHRVYNLGVPGDTSTGLLKRFDTECASRAFIRRPGDRHLIILAIGTNDSKWDEPGTKPRTTPEQFQKNIVELIAKAKQYPAKLAVFGLTRVDEKFTHPYEETTFTNDRVAQFNGIIKACCDSAEVPFLDIYANMSTESYHTLLADGLHPNTEGYDCLFQQVKQFLREQEMP